MGSIVEKPLPKERHAKIIDYALDFRSDFMDVYLIAHCKYILSTNCGITNVAQLFNVPEAWANVAPIRFSPFLSSSRFILKKLWSQEKNRLLTYNEIIENYFNVMETKKYEDAEIKLIENTSDEILDLAIEMNDLVDGRLHYSEEDENRQKYFKSLFGEKRINCGFTARIGNEYLKKNKDLMEQKLIGQGDAM